jgi:hypothetical protein
MTQDEWNASTDPQAMLAFLQTSGRASERKLRLFAVACCRRIWHLLTDERSKRAVEVAEIFADDRFQGEASEITGKQAIEAAKDRFRFGPNNRLHPEWYAAWAAATTPVRFDKLEDAALLAESVAKDARRATGGDDDQIPALLRDLVNPFRSESSMDSAQLTPELLNLAQAIYEARATHRFPELASTLEAAGCTHSDLLSHLREQGPHAGRGCWALDEILGRS